MIENIISAVNVYIVNKNKELLILKEKGNNVWLALAGAINDKDPDQVLKDKAAKELKAAQQQAKKRNH
jgi:hypothetical protein